MKNKLVLSATIALIPCLGFSLTGGPAMPEYAKFEQVGTDKLVDPNSGNFSYVIPLIEVPGPGGNYPLSLSYQSGIQHGQEASWVGLGWTLNAGNINRMVRGLPDDYLNGVQTTWNNFSDAGAQVNINVGYGGFGLAMTFDANTGSFMGATPSYSLPIPGPLGITLTPNGFNIGISHSIGLASANLTLYDSQTGGSGKVGWSVAGVSGAKGVGVSGAGAGKTTMDNIGVALPPIGGVSLAFGYTKWKYVLDEHIDDHMCGFLYQDGNRGNFVSNADYWPASSGQLPQPYIKGTGNNGGVTDLPHGSLSAARQRYERSMMKDILFPSSDIFSVSANGLGGSFEALVEPADAGVTMALPEYMDGNAPTTNVRDNEGWYVRNPAPMSKITFRMHGDRGGNLQQAATRPATQINPYVWESNKPFGDQYGSQRIVPVFEKSSDGLRIISGRLKGFRVFNPDGMIFEFMQPLHDVFSADMVFEDATKPTSNKSVKYMTDKFAYTWLITAVKGADYVSQALVSSWDATPAPGDLGHWVKFSYTTPRLTTHSTPYSGNMPHEEAESNGNKMKYMKSFGVKEVAFLSKVETESHMAKFFTETRLDALPNRLNVWENITTQSLTDPAENAAADNYVSARGVPRQTDYLDPPDNDFTWSNNFEIPGDWYSVIEYCKTAYPQTPEVCEQIDVDLEIRVTIDGSPNPFTYGNRVKRTTGTASVSNIQRTANGNTTFTASALIDLASDQECTWVRVKRAGVNWSRLYALMGNKVDFNAIQASSQEGEFPLVVNRALRSIYLYRQNSAGVEDLLVKSVDFDYDYSLCGYTPNSVGKVNGYLGKLTLKKVTISGEEDGNPNTTDAMMPYEFSYQSMTDGNPQYGNEYKKDIWGMYKKDGAMNDHLVTQPAVGASYPDPDVQAAPGVAWNLNQIKTPTGGTIKVKYTRDQYWAAGVGKEPISKTPFVMPDLYTNAPPQKANGDLDVSQMLTLQPSYFHRSDAAARQTEPLELSNVDLTPTAMEKGSHQHPSGPANLWKYPEGPSKPNFIKFAQTSPGVAKGDMLLIVYQLTRQQYNTYNRSTGQGNTTTPTNFPPTLLTTGVLNMVLVEDITTDGYKVKPLMVKDGSGNFFVYKDMCWVVAATNPIHFEYKYYVHRLNARPTTYGGDVAVTQIELNDGLGNKVVKKYEYDALDIRSGSGNKGTTNICTGCGVSSGATFGLPSVYWAKYYRFLPISTTLQNPAPGQLRLESYYTMKPMYSPPVATIIPRLDPKIMPDNPYPTTGSPNLNPVKTMIDQAYFAEQMEGGYYWPGPGTGYARAREFYSAQSDGRKLAGEIEYQFQGLSHAMVNESGNMGLFSNLQIPSYWTVSATRAVSGTPGVLTVNNAWAAKKGEVVRILKRSNASGNPIVQSEEMKYANTVTTYSGPAAADIKTAQQPGWVKQTHLSYVAGLVTTVSAEYPASITTGKTERNFDVAVETDYLAFDPLTGEPLAVKKGLSDGSSIVEYQEPVYWSLNDMAYRNRLKAATEERKYALASGETFDRTAYGKVVSAKKSVWSSDYNGYWKTHSTLGGKLRPPIMVEEYVWSQALGSNGLPTTAYTPFAGSASSTWIKVKANHFIWRNCQPIQTVNSMGETGLIIPSPRTGHPMATVQGAAYNESIVTTFQFEEDENSRFDGHHGWSRQYAEATMAGAITPFSKASWRLSATSIRSKLIYLRPGSPRGLRVSFYAKATGGNGGKLIVTPLTTAGNTISGAPAHEFPISETSDGTLHDYELDWSGSAWQSAGMARVEFAANAGATLSLCELRAVPRDALVNTYYYEPRNMNVSAIVDEAGKVSRFEYDGLGRLIAKKNSAGDFLESTLYRNYEE